MRKRPVLFDMDGTLVDSEPLHFASMLEAVTAKGHSIPSGFGEAITGKSAAECHAVLVAATGLAMTLPDFVAAKNAVYLREAHRLKLRDGAALVLDVMARSGQPMAIVSNSDRMIADANLRATGLLRPDLISVTRNDVRQGKPHPEPYLRAAYLLNVAPADCIVVEDSIPGAAAGLAAGMTVIGWPEPRRTDIAFPLGTILASPDDLLPVLSRCLMGEAATTA